MCYPGFRRSAPPWAKAPVAASRLQWTLYQPTEGGFEHLRTAWGINEKGYWYSSYRFGSSEHGGTHLDAPIHFAEGAPAVGDDELTE